MAEVTTEDLRMRQFLLGELGEKEREELEQRVVTEAGVRDKLLMAEDDLIEEYLEGSLKGEEREKFLRQFLSIPHQRNKLTIAKSVRRFARAEANIDTVRIEHRVLREANIDTVPAEPKIVNEAKIETVEIKPLDTVPIKSKRFTKPQVLPFRRKLLVYTPIAAVVLVAVTVGAIWYAKQRAARESQRQVTERKLAELNASGEQYLPADQIDTLIISSKSVTVSVSSTFTRPILELWLFPSTKQIERYNALLQKHGSQDKFQISNLQLQNRLGGKAILLRIPTPLLTPGVYRVQLKGLSADGRVAETDEYSFKIE